MNISTHPLRSHELSINSWVHVKDDDLGVRPIKIEACSLNSIGDAVLQDSEGNYHHIQDCGGIPISELFLLRLGFTLSKGNETNGTLNHTCYSFNNVYLYEATLNRIKCFAFNYPHHDYGTHLVRIRYVHQLQQLYILVTQGEQMLNNLIDDYIKAHSYV